MSRIEPKHDWLLIGVFGWLALTALYLAYIVIRLTLFA